MLPFLILSLIFASGFGLGYAVRAWRSHKHRARYLTYSRYHGGSRSRALGPARRAF